MDETINLIHSYIMINNYFSIYSKFMFILRIFQALTFPKIRTKINEILVNFNSLFLCID